MSESEQSNTSDDEVVDEHVQQAPEEHADEQEQQAPEDDSSSMSSSTSSSSSSENEEENNETREPEEKMMDIQDKNQDGEEAKETTEHEEEEQVNDNDEDDDGIFTTKDDEPPEHYEPDQADDHQQHLGEDEEEHMDDEHEEVEDGDETMQIMQKMEVSDDEEEEVDTGPTKIELEMARCKAELGEEGPYFVKLPNFLSIETRPFDPETYDDELDEDEVVDRRTRLKLKLGNTIRWRTVRDEHGNEKRESNARVIRWSDGSMSLFLGKEIFEIEKQSVDKNNHLYIRQGSALQAKSVFSEKLVFRPHSTETLTHRKMTEKMAEKTSKTQKVRVLADVGENPEAQKRELIRLEEEKLRASNRREAQQRRVRERPRNFGLTQGFLEGYDSDEGAESIAAIKHRYQHAPYGVRDQREHSLSESDEEREEQRQRRNISEAKIDSEEEEDEVMDGSDTEQRQKQQQKKKIIIEEDEDD